MTELPEQTVSALQVLDIDMGNTRTKWRCGNQTGALPAPGLPSLEPAPARVRVATVLRNRADIAMGIQQRFGVEAEFATASAYLAGVRCGYRDPRRLGIDRWLAVVAAWRRVSGAVAVVSVGTAATVDFVDANGRHEGGFIAPGWRLLGDSLGRQTADVRPDPDARPRRAPGTNTQDAVAAGTFLMLLAFVDAAIADFAHRTLPPRTVFVTGGDATLVAPRLAAAACCEPNLVLDGLAIALP